MLGIAIVARSVWRGVKSLASDPRSRGILTVALGLIAGGAMFFRQVEDLSWIDSLYFTVITLTTVGYGDISPQTTAGKLFTVLYLLIGIGILVALAGEVAAHVMAARADDEA